MKVAIYTRVSTTGKIDNDEARRNKQETENQARVLREYCRVNGWIYTEYTDEITGTGKKERPNFLRLIADAKAKKFELVLFWALDRFSREGALKTLLLLTELNSYGVNWKSYSEQYLETLGAFRDAIIAILATIAKQESLKISERSKLGQARYREQLARGTAQSRTGKNLPIGNQRTVIDTLRLVELWNSGRSQREIAEMFGCSWMTIHRRLKIAKSTGQYLRHE